MQRAIWSVGAVLVLGSATVASEPDKPEVAVTVASTLNTGSGQIRQFAFDGDDRTFFASAEDARGTDQFSLLFDKPVAVKSIKILTGRPDGSDKLDEGILEVSADGKTFEELAKFESGTAHGEPSGREIRSIRIKLAGDRKQPLVIREVAIESVPTLATFRYPVEFVVDVTDAPELKEWADKVARTCERAYPLINEELKSEGYQPPHLIRLALKNSYRGVAEASGTRITGSAQFFKNHPDDLGAMIHETAHVVQRYRSRNNPSWLVEGVADYVRFFKYEPGKLGPIDPLRARYHSSYRVSAAFLAYLTDTYDKQIVLKLNKLMREGKYKAEVFKELTNKTLVELGDEWRKTLRR